MQGLGDLGAADASSGQIWIKHLYQDGSADLSTVSTVVGELTAAMSIFVRVRGSEHDNKFGFARGNAIKTETCIQVRWAWIAFSIILVVPTPGFLVTTM
jgi:hypothetical protein